MACAPLLARRTRECRCERRRGCCPQGHRQGFSPSRCQRQSRAPMHSPPALERWRRTRPTAESTAEEADAQTLARCGAAVDLAWRSSPPVRGQPLAACPLRASMPLARLVALVEGGRARDRAKARCSKHSGAALASNSSYASIEPETKPRPRRQPASAAKLVDQRTSWTLGTVAPQHEEAEAATKMKGSLRKDSCELATDAERVKMHAPQRDPKTSGEGTRIGELSDRGRGFGRYVGGLR